MRVIAAASGTERALKFIPVELRQQLPEFSLATRLPIAEPVQAYRRFYGLNFESRFHDLKVFRITTFNRRAAPGIVDHMRSFGRVRGFVFQIGRSQKKFKTF